jgi:pimeloyl-ACP methyl ester carboxylesterase
MEILATLGRTLGFSLAAGVNLYATVAVLGLAARYGWVQLPEQFKVFDNPWIIGVAGVLYVIEFVADKIPWVDSIWDSVHTIIRPVGGALIAVAALGDASPLLMGLIALLGGTAAAGSHMTKAGTRVAINTSPEPFTNWFISLFEDVFVIGLSLFTLKFPLLALVVSVAILVMIVLLARKIWRWLRPAPPQVPTAAIVLAAALLTAPVLAASQASPSAPRWRDPSPHQVRWITVDSSVRLEVLDWGGSGPPIVLLGCYLSAHVHDDFAQKLTNQFRVYAITRRGIGASDKAAAGYTVQRSADDLREVLDSLQLQKSLVVGTSCAGQILTLFAAQHSDRLLGLVYLDGAGDPLMTPTNPPMPDPATLPRPITAAYVPDNTSFEALRTSERRYRGYTTPEAELRTRYAENPDGSVGQSRLSPVIRRAITVDARISPDYSRIRVPVLALYQAQLPFEQVAAGYAIRNEQERAALRQEYDATRALYTRFQHQLRAAVPAARIVDLPGASLFMFLSNEADVLREIRAFAATLPRP